MNDVERNLLGATIESLTAELDALKVAQVAASDLIKKLVDANAALRGEAADLRADRDALRAKLRMVVDRGRPIRLAEEEASGAGGSVGVSVVLERGEWDGVVAAIGDTKEQT